MPASYRNALVARIKIMCDLDISERRKPQDGKIKFKKYGPLDIELRVATMPSAGGVEDIVMRILQAGEPIPMAQLGILPHNLERLTRAIEKPYGLFFVCGPTGSGKTTTLHSILSHLNTPETKIWTAEDPVEITQKGLRQVQVNRKAGMDFATVMRAFLRADPDIIMVGEMRDRETVSTGIEASLTGHLVFATLHTNSAPESIVRLLDMGMDPFNFADALIGILAQRLAKRLCTHCRRPTTPDEDEVQALLAEFCEELQATEAFRRDPEPRAHGAGRLAPALRRRGRPLHAVPRGRLRRVHQGLPRPGRPARADARHRQGQAPADRARARGRPARPGAGRRHADLEDGRHREGPGRHHRHQDGARSLRQVEPRAPLQSLAFWTNTAVVRAGMLKAAAVALEGGRLHHLVAAVALDAVQLQLAPFQCRHGDRLRHLVDVEHHHHAFVLCAGVFARVVAVDFHHDHARHLVGADVMELQALDHVLGAAQAEQARVLADRQQVLEHRLGLTGWRGCPA
jgi:energy-coupling factor transporter ATP-binding protein EcfA2